GFYDRLEKKADSFAAELEGVAKKFSLNTTMNRIGSMMTTFFTGEEVTDFASAMKADTGKYSRYYRGMRAQGVYLAPSQFEASFVSAAHTSEDLEKAIESAEKVLAKL
ncbi:MAG: aspartate aminotransferase family protein, partial [Desulfobulbaceae bacterium]|nr:aspartate aminotransferase family protein [Desulfobulbaceae bacterium]